MNQSIDDSFCQPDTRTSTRVAYHLSPARSLVVIPDHDVTIFTMSLLASASGGLPCLIRRRALSSLEGGLRALYKDANANLEPHKRNLCSRQFACPILVGGRRRLSSNVLRTFARQKTQRQPKRNRSCLPFPDPPFWLPVLLSAAGKSVYKPAYQNLGYVVKKRKN